ncbi:hypothetical protein HOP50_02g12740 [Chloropicon primus]|uniref:Uncharacterized protein n=1 Tax=Chloropicon primus TaxID=1764295 RepID=A0A5B8MHD4_9CHLO|nr:hypothetical protein A3770_02p12880 [Chloropicon primus]UPQ97977.1 hypothetical protein HOP50_02g12740 [Chloropicon primus]|eukprot:QDZ18770.1 hypothetical protein A3770_02p12880 [Chloropicon primus]
MGRKKKGTAVDLKAKNSSGVEEQDDLGLGLGFEFGTESSETPPELLVAQERGRAQGDRGKRAAVGGLDTSGDMTSGIGLQYPGASPGGGFLASPEVITLRASVNDKDIELIDLRRQLQKTLLEVKSVKEEVKASDEEKRDLQRKHAQSTLKLEKEVLSKNEQVRKLSKDLRQANEDSSAHQRKLKEVSKEKNQRIDLLKEEFKVQLDAAKRHQREREEGEEQVLRLKRDLSLVKHEKKLGEDLSRNEHERLKRRMQELGDQLDQATKDCARLRGTAASKDAEIKRLRREAEEKDSRLQAAAAASAQGLPPSSWGLGGGGPESSGHRDPQMFSVPSSLTQIAQQSKLGFELHEREQRKKVDAMQKSLYKLQEKLDSRVSTCRKYKEAGRTLQRKVASLEAERYSKQSMIDALEKRINTLDQEMESACQQLHESKRDGERLQSEFEREIEKREEAAHEALREKEAVVELLEKERRNVEAMMAEVSKLRGKEREMEMTLNETASAYRLQKEELSSLQSNASNLMRRLTSADEHIEKMGSLLKEKDLDAERSRSKYQEMQALIERQEHELNGMRMQYESQMKRMQMQRQELDKFKTSHFSTYNAGRSARTMYQEHDPSDATESRIQDGQEEQIAYLRSELNRSMQREKKLILNIQDREKKLENAEKYLGNMDKGKARARRKASLRWAPNNNVYVSIFSAGSR